MGQRITVRRDEMNSGTAEFRNVVTDLMATVDGISGKFRGATDAGFLSGTLSTISQQSSSIGTSIGSINRTISNKTTELFDIDHKGAQTFNEIEICTDFYANNDSEQNEYNKVLIDKMDDKSVNEGQITNSVDVHGDETTVKGVGLVDITGEAGKEHDRQQTNVVQEAIGNVNIAENKGVVVDADSNVANKAMGNVNVAQDQGVVVDADSNVANKAISNIKKDEKGQAHESGNANVIDANLVNVNNQLQMNASGNISANTNKESLGSSTSSGSTGVTTSSNYDSDVPNIPLSTAAFNPSTSESKDTKQSSVGMGIAAGLVGAAGLAGLMSANKEEKKEQDGTKENMVQAAEEVKGTADVSNTEGAEDKKAEDDTNHLIG